jgi:hypothetical protein
MTYKYTKSKKEGPNRHNLQESKLLQRDKKKQLIIKRFHSFEN